MKTESKQILEQLLNGDHLTEDQAASLMHQLTEEEMSPAAAGALLVALRVKGETADEVRGFANTMHELARKVALPDGLNAADSVGTGGDGSGSLNLSTGCALLAAACGVPMVKHGNRSVSSKSGSADVLDALGVPFPDSPDAALACLEQCNFSFLFAPLFHPAMKAVAPVRAALGVRTVFNILGPLANPAAPPFHLIGAYDLPTARLMADTLAGMDIQRAFVVHGEPGWDEATPVGPFSLFDVRPGQIQEKRRDPAEFGIRKCSPEDLAGGDAEVNAVALEAVLNGEDSGAHRDALVLGAGLILELTGRAISLDDGIAKAIDGLDSGSGKTLLSKLRSFSYES